MVRTETWPLLNLYSGVGSPLSFLITLVPVAGEGAFVSEIDPAGYGGAVLLEGPGHPYVVGCACITLQQNL